MDPRSRRTCAWFICGAPSTPREVLEVLVQTRRNKRAALKLMRKLLKKYGFVPDKLVTDDLRSRREPDVQEICYVLYLAT